MSREQIIETLRGCEPALRARGVASLSLFGSLARGDDGPDSDVDVLIDLSPEAESRFSLFDHAGVKNLLEDALGCDVDVALRRALRSPMRERALADLRSVF